MLDIQRMSPISCLKETGPQVSVQLSDEIFPSGIAGRTSFHVSNLILNKDPPKLHVAEVRVKWPRKKLPSLVISSTPV